jgi:hypothetical protein
MCGPTACSKMCLDAARPVITRYGVCSLIHVVKLPALTEHYGSSPCSQNPLNPALALSHCFSSYLCSCRRPVWSSDPPSVSTNTPACYAIRIPLPCSQEQGSCPEAGFAGSHLISFVVISVSIIALHGGSCISFCTFFSINIFYVFVMSCVLHVLPLVVPVTSLSPYSRRQPSHQTIKDLIKYLWRVRRSDTDDTSCRKSLDLLVHQRAVYASY